MKRPYWYKLIFPALCLCLLLPGCGGEAAPPVSTGKPPALTLATAMPGSISTSAGQTSAPSNPAARPSKPEVLVPEAPGDTVVGGQPLAIDVSNADQGYVMAKYTGSAAKACIQITGPDGVTYKYFLQSSQEYKALPLTGGSGGYHLDGYENISGNKYSTLFKETVEAKLADELLPFLYPNQYVDFNARSQAVKKAEQVVKDAENDLDAVAKIYHFVVENVDYDQEKAETVTSGYLPVVDETLETGKGICFDYAALTAAMLRSQRIPAKLEIGYAGKAYHAWISVYIEEVGWIDRLIEFTGDAWTRMDPTFASSSGNSEQILKYVGDGANYQLQYSH